MSEHCKFCGTPPNASDPTHCGSRTEATACPWAVGRLDDEAANLDGMAESSARLGGKCLALGDEVKAAYWKGRARGLQLAAHNLRLSVPHPGAIPVRRVPTPETEGNNA